MSQHLELPDDLVRDAVDTCVSSERSPAEQIEFWARLGKVVDSLLRTDGRASGKSSIPLSECLKSVDTVEGRRRLAHYLERQPYPHYEPVPDAPDTFVMIDVDGTRTVGRFVDRQFQAAE